MRRPAALAAVVTLLLTAAVATPSPAAAADRSAGFKRVGYFTQWGVYGRDFQVKNLDTSGAAGTA